MQKFIMMMGSYVLLFRLKVLQHKRINGRCEFQRKSYFSSEVFWFERYINIYFSLVYQNKVELLLLITSSHTEPRLHTMLSSEIEIQ